MIKLIPKCLLIAYTIFLGDVKSQEIVINSNYASINEYQDFLTYWNLYLSESCYKRFNIEIIDGDNKNLYSYKYDSTNNSFSLEYYYGKDSVLKLQWKYLFLFNTENAGVTIVNIVKPTEGVYLKPEYRIKEKCYYYGESGLILKIKLVLFNNKYYEYDFKYDNRMLLFIKERKSWDDKVISIKYTYY